MSDPAGASGLLAGGAFVDAFAIAIDATSNERSASMFVKDGVPNAHLSGVWDAAGTVAVFRGPDALRALAVIAPATCAAMRGRANHARSS